MPAMLCHQLLGERLIPELRRREDTASISINAFLWGCQGPDVLFYHRLLPWQKGQDAQRFGYKLHGDRPSRLFDALRRMLSDCPREDYDVLLGYALGMCCHYGYDRTAHPYINQLEYAIRDVDERGRDYFYHGMVEAMLDIIMLRHDREQLPSDINLADAVPNDKHVARVIAKVYQRLLSELYDFHLNDRDAALIAPDTRTIAKWLNDPSTIKRPLFQKIEQMAKVNGKMTAFMRPLMEDMKYDYANTGHAVWRNHHNPAEESSMDFFELTDAAELDSWCVIDFFLDNRETDASFAEFTGERTFSFNIPPLKKKKKPQKNE